MSQDHIKGAAAFLVACVASPCCTPLIVPLALAALAGMPIAAWMGFNLGWVYGGLTLLSIGSLVFAVRQLRRAAANHAPENIAPTPEERRIVLSAIPPQTERKIT